MEHAKIGVSAAVQRCGTVTAGAAAVKLAGGATSAAAGAVFAGGGTGWEAYTSVGQTKADLIATELYKEAEKEFAPDGWKIRKDTSDGDPDKESQFYILKHTKCPAVLVENFFMDTRKDCAFIQSEDGRNRVSKVIFEAIKSVCYGRVI